MRRRLVAACTVVVMAVAWACGGSGMGTPPPEETPAEPRARNPVPNPGNPPGNPDAGTPPGNPDAGTPPGNPDAGTPPDPGTPPQAGPGPWPDEPMVNYSQRYDLGARALGGRG